MLPMEVPEGVQQRDSPAKLKWRGGSLSILGEKAALINYWMTGWLIQNRISCSMSNQRQCYEMKNSMNSISRTFRVRWKDTSGLVLPVFLSCTSLWIRGRITPWSGHCGSTCWTCLEILLHFVRLSILCHGLILMLPSLNRYTPYEFQDFFSALLNLPYKYLLFSIAGP